MASMFIHTPTLEQLDGSRCELLIQSLTSQGDQYLTIAYLENATQKNKSLSSRNTEQDSSAIALKYIHIHCSQSSQQAMRGHRGWFMQFALALTSSRKTTEATPMNSASSVP